MQRVSELAVAGITPVTSDSVDLLKLRGVSFVVTFGVITAGSLTDIVIELSDNDSSWTPEISTNVLVDDTHSQQIYAIEIGHVLARYARCVVARNTQNSVVDSILALGTSPGLKPFQRHVSVGSSTYYGTL